MGRKRSEMIEMKQIWTVPAHNSRPVSGWFDDRIRETPESVCCRTAKATHHKGVLRQPFDNLPDVRQATALHKRVGEHSNFHTSVVKN